MRDLEESNGTPFVFDLLRLLIIDPLVDVSMSTMSLTVLVHLWGPEALMVDDGIHTSLFGQKNAGRFESTVYRHCWTRVLTKMISHRSIFF